MPYPLRLRPIYKSVMWGGRRMETHLGRRLPVEDPVGESWELADFDDPATGKTYSSTIDNGPLKGRTLREAIAEYPEAILGPGRRPEPFPLLIKYIDARENLSVQVHPDEAAAARIGEGARPKTECWFILHAEPGACIYRGLAEGTTPEVFRRAVEEGTLQRHLIREEVRPGEMYFVPAGTVHAIGAGVLLAEVQQASDTTYRLWDWNRTDPKTGKARELHIERGLAAVDWNRRPPPPSRRSAEDAGTLVECLHFNVGYWRKADGGGEGKPRPRGQTRPGRPEVWVCLEGGGRVHWPGGETLTFGRNDTLLLPPGGSFELEVHSPLEVLHV
jgi:mannose-6-phosphate isomerase